MFEREIHQMDQIQGGLCPCSSGGRRHVNGVDLHLERTGAGEHGVLLLPGALGKYAQHMAAHRRDRLTPSHLCCRKRSDGFWTSTKVSE